MSFPCVKARKGVDETDAVVRDRCKIRHAKVTTLKSAYLFD